jgi:crotonobetainyl-CoA:carnitine CoA-transferase CaiB-like acyl-CoA transferase
MPALAGTRVIDLSHLLPGPLATLVMAEAGASVLRVERPGGDEMRGYPPTIGPDMSAFFALLNRGKDTIELDLKHDADLARLHKLIADADVLVEQFRPGVMDRLGLSYEKVRQINPRLVYCSITGYGQDGPAANVAGHDINYLARTGLLALSSGVAAPPTFPVTPLADIAGGSYPAVMNITMALLQRERTGEGVHLDVSMADSVFTLAYWGLGILDVRGTNPVPGEELFTGGSPRYGFYGTSDGRFLAIAAVEDRFWTTLCDILGLDEAARDDRDDPEATRRDVAARIAQHTAAEWEERLVGHDVCCEVVRSLSEARQDPHFAHRGVFDYRVATGGADITALPVPVDRGLRRGGTTLPAPGVGMTHEWLTSTTEGNQV